MESNDDKALLRNNPLFVIGLASLAAIAMFTISFLSYYNSDTKKTIEQIQTNSQRNASEAQGDTTLPADLSPEYLTTLEGKIEDSISTHSDDTEFSPDELTDSALGL